MVAVIVRVQVIKGVRVFVGVAVHVGDCVFVGVNVTGVGVKADVIVNVVVGVMDAVGVV